MIELADEAATEQLAAKVATAIKCPLVVYLHGELGAGKTAFCRGVLRALGHQGAVKSPTYTLVEPYQVDHLRIHHFDLYRLADPEELEFMGIRDYFADDTVNFIEWPERGQGWLPAADLDIRLYYHGDGRKIQFQGRTQAAEQLLQQL